MNKISNGKKENEAIFYYCIIRQMIKCQFWTEIFLNWKDRKVLNVEFPKGWGKDEEKFDEKIGRIFQFKFSWFCD